MGVKIVETALRDGHQSLFATRMTTEEILSAIDDLDKAGYYSLEVWGGATFDACMRFLNEDPWERLRKIRARVRNTKLQMLFRGQNILGYRHYSDDVVEMFVKKSLENGIDIIRVFDALNDVRNLKCAVDATKKYGGHCQIALSYTTSPVHTVDYYVTLAQEVERMGADSLCIKDMAGVLLPDDAYELVSRLKRNTKLPIDVHSHCTGGMMDMTYLKAIEAGADIVDCAISPLSGGTSQPASEAFQYVLAGTEHDPHLDLEALGRAAVKLGAVRDKYLANGLLNPKALSPDPRVLKFQLPGGMLSNLMSQLKEQNAMNRYEEVLKEVPRVRKDLGYPPLVTPLSQMVGTQAVMNVMTGERYRMVPNEIKEYLHGFYGKSPAPVDEEIRRKIIGDDAVITHRPADDLAPEFEGLKAKYRDLARSDEDVLSLALFEAVAQKYLSQKYAPPISAVETVEFDLKIGGR
ncbi:MAG: oxaloacetate decarboxylase subunit alpha [Candidatus Izemoplasmatales bacterium]